MLENTNINNKRVCSECGSSKTYIKKDGRPEWRRDSLGRWICKRCYNEIINPMYNPIHNKIHNPRRLTYKGKVMQMKSHLESVCVIGAEQFLHSIVLKQNCTTNNMMMKIH